MYSVRSISSPSTDEKKMFDGPKLKVYPDIDHTACTEYYCYVCKRGSGLSGKVNPNSSHRSCLLFVCVPPCSWIPGNPSSFPTTPGHRRKPNKNLYGIRSTIEGGRERGREREREKRGGTSNEDEDHWKDLSSLFLPLSLSPLTGPTDIPEQRVLCAHSKKST